MNDRVPSLELDGLKVFVARDGDRVTGRVIFPYETYGRTEVPIDYLNSASPGAGPVVDQSRAREEAVAVPAATDARHTSRRSAVRRYLSIRTTAPDASRTALARRVAASLRISVRTLQLWVHRFQLEGESGLADRYVAPPPETLHRDVGVARDAVLVCAWWSFRIGNLDDVDSRAVHSAASLFPSSIADRPTKIPVGDALAAIDCYYSWPCDRQRYPFKSFQRWFRYEFEQWLLRAADANDYRAALGASDQSRAREEAVDCDSFRADEGAVLDPYRAREEAAAVQSPIATRQSSITEVPLRRPSTRRASNVPDDRTRRRDANARSTRSAIRRLAVPDPCRACEEADPELLRASRFLAGIGNRDAARDILLQDAAPPATIAEALRRIEDRFRVVILAASKGDRTAFDQALATLPLWWERMPQEVRHNVDFKIDAWRADHPRVSDPAVRRRRLQMFLVALHSRRGGFHRLAVAAAMGA